MKNINDPYAVAYILEDAEEAIFRNYELGYFNTGTNMTPSVNDEIILAANFEGKKFAMTGIIDRAFTDAEKIELGMVDKDGKPSTYPTFWAMWENAPVSINAEFKCTQGGNIAVDDRMDIWNELTGENRKPAKVIKKIAAAERKKVRDAKRAAKLAASSVAILAALEPQNVEFRAPHPAPGVYSMYRIATTAGTKKFLAADFDALTDNEKLAIINS